MSRQLENIQVTYHRAASAAFFNCWNAFEKAVDSIDRKARESEYQRVKKTYAGMLEAELQEVSKEVLKAHRNGEQEKEYSLMLQQFNREYLHRLVQKINDL